MTEETKGAHLLTDAEHEAMAREIPLPPEALFAELDNAAPAPRPDAAAAPAASPERLVAEPDYVDGPETATVPLSRPFRLDDVVWSEIVVRPLNVVEMGRVVAAHEKPDVFDFYAAMTGLPAATIRGLRGADGEAVTEACFPFLPRFMKPADG